MSTIYYAKPGEVLPTWHHFDADGVVLGRLSARIAMILQGKHHARYTPHVDTGDFVVVTNARKVIVTGAKRDGRVHRWHTGFLGGLREVTTGQLLEQRPERVVELAVRRMLPKTRLGRAMFRKLKVYPGPEHPHVAQKPVQADSTPFKPKGS